MVAPVNAPSPVGRVADFLMFKTSKEAWANIIVGQRIEGSLGHSCKCNDK